MVQRSARLGEARLGETRLGEGVITFEQELSDTQPILDEPTVLPEGLEVAQISETINVVDNVFPDLVLRTFRPSDTINVIDEPRYETFLRRFGDDSTAVTDDLFRKYILHRFGDDTQSVLDEIQRDPEFVFTRLLGDSSSIIDDPRYEAFLHRFASDTQSILDEIFINFVFPPIQLSDLIYAAGESNFDEVFWDKTYFDTDVLGTKGAQIFNRFGDDVLSFLDDIRYITFLHRFADDTTTLDDNIRYETFLHRLLDETQTIVDEPQYLTFLHRFLDDSQSVLDELFTELTLIKNVLLSDVVYPAGETRFDQVYWDKSYFDQRVQLIFDLVREFSDTQTVVDDLFRKYILQRFGDDTITVVDALFREYILHRFGDDTVSILDEPRYETFLHRFASDLQPVLDELGLETILTILREMSDRVYVAGKAGFDEVFWDKIYFDQDIQFVFDLVRTFSELQPVADDVRYTTFLHRFLDETQSIVDEPRYITLLHRFLSETQTVLDEILTQASLIKTVLLDDTVYPAGESRFNEVYFDKSYFDQRVQLVFDLVREFSDILSFLDDVRYETFLHRFADDTQSILDQSRYTTFLHRLLADVQSTLDEVLIELEAIKNVFLSDVIYPNVTTRFDEVYWDKSYFDQNIQFIFNLVREFDDTQAILDEARYTTFLHRFLDEAQPILDEIRYVVDWMQALSDILTVLDDIESIKEAFKTVRLSDLAFVSGEARFDEIRWDGGRFDQRVQLIFDYVREFTDITTVLDAVRAFFDIGVIIELEDFIDFESFFDTAEFDEHHFDSEDRIRITYILHRFFVELLTTVDEISALKTLIRRLSDATTLADTFFVFEGGLIIPFGSIIRLHRLSAVENALILFPLDVGVEKAERADSIQIPFGDDVIQATGASKKKIRVDCLWVENGDQAEENLKADLVTLENADQIKVTFFLQKLLTKDYKPVKLESFSVQKVRGRSDILRVRLIFIEDTN